MFIKYYLLPTIFIFTTAFYFSPFIIDLVSPGKFSGFLFGMNLIVWLMLLLTLGIGYLVWLIRHATRKTLSKHHWLSAGIIYALYAMIITLSSMGYVLSV